MSPVNLGEVVRRGAGLAALERNLVVTVNDVADRSDPIVSSALPSFPPGVLPTLTPEISPGREARAKLGF